MKNNLTNQIPAVDKFVFVWLLILTSDLFFNYLPQPIYFLTLIALLFRSSRIELSFILIFFPGIMFIDVLNNPAFTGNTALLVFLSFGILIISKDIWDLRTSIFRAMLPLLVILLAFLITYTYAPKGYYSAYKIVAIITRGIADFLFFVVFIKTNKFNNNRLSLFLLFLFIFFLQISFSIGFISTPDGILDIGFIRNDLDATLILGINYLGYHQFGALALFAIVFSLAGTKRLNWFLICIIFTGTYFGFLSGARQMIFGIIGILFIYSIKYFRKNMVVLIPTILFAFAFITLIISDIKVPFISEFLLNEDVLRDDGRRDLYKEAIRIFKEKPMMGAGIGGYDPTGTERNYPHNIVLEVLAEGGLFMLTILILSLFIIKRKSHYNWWNPTINGTVFLFLILGFAIRGFSSSDLVENIALISALCAIGIYKKDSPFDNNVTQGTPEADLFKDVPSEER